MSWRIFEYDYNNDFLSRTERIRSQFVRFMVPSSAFRRCGRNAGYQAPHTVPDVRFSRIRFLGCTRFRTGLSQRTLMRTPLSRRFWPGYLRVFKHTLELLPPIASPLAPAVQPLLRVPDTLAIK